MAPPTLLRLDLRESIAYDPIPVPAPDLEGFFPGLPDREGEEFIHLFGEALLIQGPEGPRCARPLPFPLASGRRGPGAIRGEEKGGLVLEAGAWLFMQWRPTGPAELARGIEWFAREAWWERQAREGLPLLRLVREDGRIAYQLLWRVAPR